jgi:NADH-quinone oxidoreductase subunit C
MTIKVSPERIIPVCRSLHDEFGFNYLTDLCGIDRYPVEPRFWIVYHLCSMERRQRLRIKTALPNLRLQISSITSIWKAADWLEREVFDMYGIWFEGHPDLRRILLPPEWKGFPLRKDYPLRGLE